MNNKNTKTILFTSLIVTMILPFSGISTATAEESETSKINKLGNSFERKYLKWIETDNPKAKQNLKKQMDFTVEQLEEYGITYTENYLQNKSYWIEQSSKDIGQGVTLSSTDPLFYAGYGYGCWWILTCSQWDNNPVQLGNGDVGNRLVYLKEDHSWTEGWIKVTGSQLAVEYNFVSKLMDNTTIKQTVSGSDGIIFLYDSIHVKAIGQNYDNPKNGWFYDIQYSVMSIV